MRKLRFLVAPGSFREGPGATVVLPYEEARHIRVTLRGKPGMIVHLFDGEGKEYRGQVAAVTPTQVQIVLVAEESDAVEAPLRIVALQGVSHDESFEHAVEQMTSLGVASIVPLLVERSKMGDRAPDSKRLTRWQRIAREACKLSWRRLVPPVGEPVAPAGLPSLEGTGTIGFLLDPEAPLGSFHQILAGPRPDTVHVAIGPEGGFSPAENDTLRAAGYRPVCLGPRVLKTEHAGAAALALILARWGDIG